MRYEVRGILEHVEGRDAEPIELLNFGAASVELLLDEVCRWFDVTPEEIELDAGRIALSVLQDGHGRAYPEQIREWEAGEGPELYRVTYTMQVREL